MKRIKRKNIHSYCRTCLSEVIKYSVAKGQKYNVYQTKDLAKWFAIFISVEVAKDDGYPKFLCKQCFDKFKSFKEFRNLCIQSKTTLDGTLGRTEQYSTKAEILEDEIGTICKDEEKQEEHAYDNATSLLEKNYEYEKLNTGDESDDKTSITALNTQKNIPFKDEIDVPVELSDYNLDEKETFEKKSCSEKDVQSFHDGEQRKNKKRDQNLDDSFAPDAESEELGPINLSKEMNSKLLRRRDKNSDEPVRMEKNPDKKFKCQHCTRWFMKQKNLFAHIRIHQGLKAYQCSQCHRGYNKVSRLNAHINDVHQEVEVEITCSFNGCGKIFRRNGSYRAHFRKFHTEMQSPRTAYMCEQCGRTYKRKATLEEHRYKHASEEEYPYHCEQCGKRFTSPRTFKEHQMRHAGIKNFVCPFCGLKKTTRYELRTHINYHTKEKQWHCPDCTSVFNSSASLNLHVRVVHKGIRRYACRYCEQSFGKAETLKHHEMRHTGEKPHACDVCGKCFIQIVALRKHLKIHNKVGEKLTTKNQKID